MTIIESLSEARRIAGEIHFLQHMMERKAKAKFAAIIHSHLQLDI